MHVLAQYRGEILVLEYLALAVILTTMNRRSHYSRIIIPDYHLKNAYKCVLTWKVSGAATNREIKKHKDSKKMNT